MFIEIRGDFLVHHHHQQHYSPAVMLACKMMLILSSSVWSFAPEGEKLWKKERWIFIGNDRADEMH